MVLWLFVYYLTNIYWHFGGIVSQKRARGHFGGTVLHKLAGNVPFLSRIIIYCGIIRPYLSEKTGIRGHFKAQKITTPADLLHSKTTYWFFDV